MPEKHFCPTCRQTLYDTYWCQQCQSRQFREEACNWTAGDPEVNDFILWTQLNARECNEYIEWIPFTAFASVHRYDQAELGVVFSANWDRGPADTYDQDEERFVRERPWVKVALVTINEDGPNFMRELKMQYRTRNGSGLMCRIFGVTREAITGNLMMVIESIEWDLRHYVSHHWARLAWPTKIGFLHTVVCALEDFYTPSRGAGRISDSFARRTKTTIKSHIDLSVRELGLSEKKDIVPVIGYCKFDVIGFVAPEILRGGQHTAKSDVYAFGTLMYEFAINKPVYYDIPHDAYLLDQIAHAGYRARLGYGMPESYAELLRACWSQNPASRPSVRRLRAILDEWHIEGIHESQFRRAEKYRVQMLESRGFETTGPMVNPTIMHPQAIYTSRLLRFPVMPPSGRAPPRRRATADAAIVTRSNVVVSDQSFFTSTSLLRPRNAYAEPEPEIDDDELEREYELALPVDGGGINEAVRAMQS